MSTDYERLDSIKPKWKALAFEQFVGNWDEDEANASTAFDNLQECDSDELEGVVEALGISWQEIYRHKSDQDIAFEMSHLAWLMQNCDNQP
jgi:hypothetical protein